MKNFNISFIINDNHNDGYEDYPTATEALYDEMYSDDEDEEEIKPSKRKKNEKQVLADVAAFTKMKEIFANLPAEDKENPTIKKMIEDINKKEKRYLKQEERQTKQKKIENTRKLKALLRERDVMNDLQYFNEKMSIAEQESALLQIEEIKKYNDITKPYRLTLLDAAIPAQYKAIAYRKISALRTMEPGSGDYYKMKNWVDTFMQIPFGAFKNLPITINDGVEKCHEFMDNAKQILDQAVYGLNDAKLQIMQMVGQWIVNPSAIGTAIAIKGPMGTGKTTLVKEGISKILGRDFVFIALGGATDSSFLEGHSYTYEGSTWGKIVDLLIKCKSMNPVIYFDELDKISDTPKGEEIAGILTHLTDTAQNNQFHDRYFSEIDFDLSRCLFIFSYNDESKVNKILLDRMYRIQTQGYNQEQKTTISNKYLVPKICEQVKFQPADIKISDATLHYIITNYTDKEDGVRTLKRCLEIIYTKLNLYRLMRPDTNIFESEMSIKVEFPMEVSPAIVDKLIKKNVDSGSWHNMYM
jgi:ATP-dependent Lon protease